MNNIRKALAELVALKDLKDRLTQLHEMGHGTDYGDYHKRKPLAWDAARAALAEKPSVREPLKAEQLWDHSELMELNGDEMGLSMDAMMRFTRMIEAMHGIGVKGEA